MIKKDREYYTLLFARVAVVLGIAEMLAGLASLVFRHDSIGGYSLLSIGAATFGSAPAIRRRRAS